MSGVAPLTADAGTDAWAAFRQPPSSTASTQPAPTGEGGGVPVSSGGGITIELPSGSPNAPAQSNGDPWAAFRSPPKASASSGNDAPKSFSAGDAAAGGALDALTMGLAPAMQGVYKASLVADPDQAKELTDAAASGVPEAAAGIPVAAAMKAIWQIFNGNKNAGAAYTAGRQSALQDQQNAQAQHPYAFTGGQIGGALLGLPAFGAGGGETFLARLLAAAGAGAGSTAAFNAGSSVSAGNSVPMIAKNALEGVGSGALFGLLGGGAAEGAGAIVSRLASGLLGGVDAGTQAASNVVNRIAPAITKGPPIDLDAMMAAGQAGLPLTVADMAGAPGRSLARASANMSPEARDIVTDFDNARFEQQAPRIANFVRSIAGNPDTMADNEALQAMARAANKPAYARAYAAGDRPIWSPEIEQLAGTPDVAAAAQRAVQRGQNRAVLDGFGAFNPKLTVTDDGRLLFNRGPNGVPTYPNLQFFDYVQRELRDAATAAQRRGENEQAATLFGLHGKLLDALDAKVPEFKTARSTAAAFFGAQDAGEAGRKFVMSNAKLPEARAAFAKMNPAEREMFARNFASELSDQIERTGYSRNVLNAVFLNSPAARQKIQMALGRERADQLEALLRAETLAQRFHAELGNSTTARQLKEMGDAGAHGAGSMIALTELMGPIPAIASRFAGALLRHGANAIDEKVAVKVAELLTSQSPVKLAQGVRLAIRNRRIFNALRAATGASARIGAHDLGARKAIAIGGALAGFGGDSEKHSLHDAREEGSFAEP
jgi:hypothetical protein